MGEISRVNSGRAINDPAGEFDHPREVVDHPGLTRVQKLKALEVWWDEIKARCDAAGEGMTPPPGTLAGEAELLRDIEKALEVVKSIPREAGS